MYLDLGCKTTSIRHTPREAYTLIELMIASTVGIIVLTALLGFSVFSYRSFAALTNYLDLDQKTQMALDKMSREIRQVNKVTGFSATSVTFEDFDGATLSYLYDPNQQVLTRTKAAVTETLLTGCDSLHFSVFQRNPSNDTFQPYTTTNATDTKLVELTWNCSRTLLGRKANTDSMQSAKVVIRKK